jgi:cytochrome c553
MSSKLKTVNLKCATALATLLLVFNQAQAGDVAAGAKKAEVCAACHGKDGNTPIDPSYPRLAGQYRDFLYQALMDYKSERRKNAIMVAQAKQLSKSDIDNLAAYYASLPGQLTHKRAAAK